MADAVDIDGLKALHPEQWAGLKGCNLEHLNPLACREIAELVNAFPSLLDAAMAARAEVTRLRDVIASNAKLARSSVGPHAVARAEALEDAAKKCDVLATRLPGPSAAGAHLCASEIRAMIGDA